MFLSMPNCPLSPPVISGFGNGLRVLLLVLLNIKKLAKNPINKLTIDTIISENNFFIIFLLSHITVS